MQKKMIQAIALALTLASSSAWAKWTLDGNTATDGEFTFNVQNASTKVSGELAMFSITKATDKECELDLTSFETDTEGKKIVEIITVSGHKLGDILSVTGVVAPDMKIVGEYGFGTDTLKKNYVLKKIHLSPDLKYLGRYACQYLHALDDFYPLNMEKLTTGLSGAFDRTSLKGDIRLPELEEMGYNFFRHDSAVDSSHVTSVYAPKLKVVGSRAFNSQSALTNVTISAEATLIDDYAFEGCPELESVEPRTLPSLAKVGTGAFHGDAKLSGCFSLPACIAIGGQAFQDCARLNEIEVSPDLASLGGYAFWKCVQFTNFAPRVFTKFTGTVGDYVFGGQTAETSTKLVGDYDFGGASGVGEYSFAYTAITSIRFTNAVSVGSYAFRDCKSMTNAVFSSLLKSIDAQGFCNCQKLESFEPFLPPGMTKLAYAAFDSCKKLKTPLVWKSPALTTFAGTTFGGCLCLTNVTINSYIKDFTGGAFNNISDGCCFYWNVAAPETITQPIVGGAPNGFRFYIKAGKNDPAWKAWTTDATFGKSFSKQTYGYPGRKTFGLLQDTTYASAVQMWLIDNEPRGIAIIVR